MRIPMIELVEITHKKTPRAQAGWFKKHFHIAVEYDCNGVIITTEAFNSIVASQYKLSAANDEMSHKRPKVKLNKSHAKTLAA